MSANMQRRDFLRRAALVAAGVVAADQLDLLDRMGWTRKFFPSAALTDPYRTDRDAWRVGDLWVSENAVWYYTGPAGSPDALRWTRPVGWKHIVAS